MQASPPPPSVRVEGLSVRFRARSRGERFVDALVDVDVTCSPGEIVGFLGPNGSGKTTLFRALCGELAPRAGRIEVLGRAPGDRALVTRVGYQPDDPVPFPQLGARELLRHLGDLMGLPAPLCRARADALLERMGLADVARRRIRALSTGMNRRLAIAAALLADPELLVLDEPTSGLDPNGSRIVLEMLRERADGGATVLLASHRLDEVEETCSRAVLLHRGRVRAQGSLDELLGTGSALLEVVDASADARASIEAAALAAGAGVVGWSRRRRHPYDLFRELEAEDPT